MYEHTWMAGESRPAVANVGGPVGSDLSGPSDGFKPGHKLRARIKNLAKWRINPTSISLGNGSEYHGGHAAVSKATMNWGTDSWHGPNVAVKKMRIADDTNFERVLGLAIREAEFLAKLDHKNIVELQGFVEDVAKGTIWLVFPWAEYGTLKDFIARDKWDIPERISLISDVAKGLAYLHTRNPPICHGDLKSPNVLIYCDPPDFSRESEKIHARIADFGSARRLPQRDPNTQIDEMATQLPSAQPLSAAFCASTKTITLTGNKYTLRWAAPELLLQDELSLWSDIWAMGWIAYEAMTGSLPFEDAASEMAVVERVVEGKLPSLTNNAHLLLIHELCSLMNMCWQTQPTQRPTADSCRRSIDKMPMFAPAMKGDERILEYEHLRHLGQIYESRGEYARAFTFLAEALHAVTRRPGLKDRIQGLRTLAQLARLRESHSETVAIYDVISKIYAGSDRKDTGRRRLRKESEGTGGLHHEDQNIRGQQRVAKALCTMPENHRLERSHDQAIRLNTIALKISTDLGHRKGRADALWGLAEAHRDRHEYEEAIPLYSEVLGIRTDLGDKRGRASALWGLADVHRRGNQYEEAISLYSEALEIRTDFGDEEDIADALEGLADVHRRQSEYKKAIALYSEVLKIRTNLGDRKGSSSALWGLADVHRRRREYRKAVIFCNEVLKIRADLDDDEGRADALWDLADVYRRRREYKKAISLYSEVLKIRTDRGDKKGRASALWGLADVHRRRSEYERAVLLYSEVLGVRTDLGARQRKPAARLSLADMSHDEVDDGDDLCQQVADILEPARGLADSTSDDEWLIRLRISVLNWLVRRVGIMASDSTKGPPTETAAEVWVRSNKFRYSY